jgi:hypothetical protein
LAILTTLQWSLISAHNSDDVFTFHTTVISAFASSLYSANNYPKLCPQCTTIQTAIMPTIISTIDHT